MTYLKNGFDKTIQEFLKDAFIFEKELNKQKRISDRDYELVSVPTVSYTHLDVYKRQGCDRLYAVCDPFNVFRVQMCIRDRLYFPGS